MIHLSKGQLTGNSFPSEYPNACKGKKGTESSFFANDVTCNACRRTNLYYSRWTRENRLKTEK